LAAKIKEFSKKGRGVGGGGGNWKNPWDGVREYLASFLHAVKSYENLVMASIRRNNNEFYTRTEPEKEHCKPG